MDYFDKRSCYVDMKYSLRQLEIFLANAHQENISPAAEALAMFQSAASSALKECDFQFVEVLTKPAPVQTRDRGHHRHQ